MFFMSPITRVSKGVPTGGEFAAQNRSESAVTLTEPPVSPRFASPAKPGIVVGSLVHVGIDWTQARDYPFYEVLDTVDYLDDNSRPSRAYQVIESEFKKILDEDGTFDPNVDARWVGSWEISRTVNDPYAASLLDAPTPVAEPAPVPVAVPLIETQRQRRGQKFITVEAKKWPALYATELVPVDEKKIFAHYFGGPFDYHLAEYDQVTHEAFGYIDHGSGGEWGYFNLKELEQRKFGWNIIERDAHFHKGAAADVIDGYSK
jgi:hypothetical protein